MKNRGQNLKTLSDLRRFMAKITNQLYRGDGEMAESKARCLAYMASILRDVIKESDLENRITELELKIKEQKN